MWWRVPRLFTRIAAVASRLVRERMNVSMSRKLILVLAAASTLTAADADFRLWYRQPAVLWEEALPVGNGRLGAMVFGGIARERIQFNESTVWQGEPHDYAHPGAYKY